MGSRFGSLPRTYWLYAVLTTLGPVLIALAQGDALRPRTSGVLLFGLLLWRLARGSRVVWVLLLGWELVLVLTVAAVFDGGSAAGWPLLLVGIGCVALLVSPSMRAHIATHRGHVRSAPA